MNVGRRIWLAVPLLFVIGTVVSIQLYVAQRSAVFAEPDVDHSVVNVPLPPGATAVAAEAPYPDQAATRFHVPLPLPAVSEYYNKALGEKILKSQGYTMFVNGWEGTDDPPPAPGQTQWPLVRLSGVGDGSLDSLDIAATAAPDGGTSITAAASRWIKDGPQLKVSGVIKAY
jgi:hypothetical protein